MHINQVYPSRNTHRETLPFITANLIPVKTHQLTLIPPQKQPIIHDIKSHLINRSLLKQIQRDSHTTLMLKGSIFKTSLRDPLEPEYFTDRPRNETLRVKLKTQKKSPVRENNYDPKKIAFLTKKHQEQALSNMFAEAELKFLNQRSKSVPRIQSITKLPTTEKTDLPNRSRTNTPVSARVNTLDRENPHTERKPLSQAHLESQNSTIGAVKLPKISFSRTASLTLSPQNRLPTKESITTSSEIFQEQAQITTHKDSSGPVENEDDLNPESDSNKNVRNEVEGYVMQLKDGQVKAERSPRKKPLGNKQSVLDLFESIGEEEIQRKRRDGSNGAVSQAIVIGREGMKRKNVVFSKEATKGIFRLGNLYNRNAEENDAHKIYTAKLTVTVAGDETNNNEKVVEEIIEAELMDADTFTKKVEESERIAGRLKEKIRRTEPPIDPLLLKISHGRRRTNKLYYSFSPTKGSRVRREGYELAKKEMIENLIEVSYKVRRLKLTISEVPSFFPSIFAH